MEFRPFGKIPRLNREVIITEKIDGTNGQILILDFKSYEEYYLARTPYSTEGTAEVEENWDREKKKNGAILVGDFLMRPASRSRYLNEKQDNYGFWKWCNINKEQLALLGPGHHYGEWWGNGINRGYGLGEKRFSLFNTARWGEGKQLRPSCCGIVPVLASGTSFSDVPRCLQMLRDEGSYAAPGYRKPEGVVVSHTASNSLFKVTLEDDDKPKGANENA